MLQASMTRRLVLLSLVTLSVLITPSSTEAAGTNGTDVQVSGLPEGLMPDIYLVAPHDGGGYVRQSHVGALKDVQVRPKPDQLIEAAPIFVSEVESFQPTTRFQPAAARVQFLYERRFLVTVSVWSRGDVLGQPYGGEVTRGSEWVAAGSVFSTTAVPRTGWRIAHWGVFASTEPGSTRRVSGHGNVMSTRIDRPTHLVVGFVPER